MKLYERISQFNRTPARVLRINWDSWFEIARKLLLRRLLEAQIGCFNKTSNNGPFPSSKTSHFQNEASAKSFL